MTQVVWPHEVETPRRLWVRLSRLLIIGNGLALVICRVCFYFLIGRRRARLLGVVSLLRHGWIRVRDSISKRIKSHYIKEGEMEICEDNVPFHEL